MALKVMINGFGRIGRCAARILSNDSECEIVAINDTATRDLTRYLLQYDTVHGEFNKKVEIINDDYIAIDGRKIRVYSTRAVEDLDLTGVDVALECTGKMLTSEKSAAYLKQGAKKVVMSAPAKDATPTFVLGVNENRYNGEAIISNASCTTNCLGPVMKILDDAFGVQKALMTTVHAYTNGQSLVDVKCRDLRRSRAAAQNIIPTTTGAAKAMKLIMPHLEGKIHGQSMRVPVPNVSLVDVTAVVGGGANSNLGGCGKSGGLTKEAVNEAFANAAAGSHKGLVIVDFDERVSSDFCTTPYSAVVAADMTQVICGDFVKVMAWYDNEWGYTMRLVEMAKFISK